MKIVIADDHALFMDGLKNLLESRGYQVIGTAKDGMEAFSLAKKLQPDVMLIDIFMPNCDGLEATMLINANFPKIKIVILTSSENEEDVFNAVKYGACGYFIKTFNSDRLFELLSALELKETPVSPGLAGKVLGEFQTGEQESAKSNIYLTDRQREVLSLVTQGHIYKEIAENLGISERTVKYHIQSAIDKLHLQNRQQLISYASKAGLLNE
jgi:DNA-binding NarL/FixJ family response regulator